MNINTKEYWDNRFKSGDWDNMAKKQTREYALANTKYIDIKNDFYGTILDFGCALGDAIPVYKERYPNAKIYGFDISENAIKYCRKKYGKFIEFFTGTIDEISYFDIIIASHVMEHITNDKELVANLMNKCNDLYIFVPYKENPLFHEHVNYYDEYYYSDLKPVNIKVFEVCYRRVNSVKEIIKNFLKLRFSFITTFNKSIIMFHFINR